MKNNNVLIIGAGIGGLAVGIRLAAEGFRVRIIEKGSRAGGWLQTSRIGDIIYPNAGSLVTMPQQLEDLFKSTGRNLEDYLTFEETSPILRFFFPETNEYTLYREPADTMMKNELFGLQDQQGFTAYSLTEFWMNICRNSFPGLTAAAATLLHQNSDSGD